MHPPTSRNRRHLTAGAQRFLAVLLSSLLVLQLAPIAALGTPAKTSEASQEADSRPFPDVEPGTWYYGVAEYALEHDIIMGTSEGLFDPSGATTRAAFMTIIHRLEGSPAAASDEPAFTDLAPGAFYADAVNWAAEEGLAEGYSDGRFGPEDTITREQAAVFFYRYAKYRGEDVTESADLDSFVDASELSAFAAEPMRWACATGLISGTSETTLDPQGEASRSQVAAIFMRFCEKYDVFGTTQNPGGSDSSVKRHTVTFVTNSNSTVEPQRVEDGETAVIPENPENGELFFAGWYEEDDPKDWADAFSFDTPITKDLTLHALWVNMTDDTDGDGIPDALEEYIGTDPAKQDSDGDGLTDYEERMYFQYDPLKRDTDGDGTEDGNEDFDGDGLTNLTEKSGGTSPILRDTDGDGLDDNEEPTYNTDPTKYDTDGDGASDGDEVRLGTNPISAETSFNEKAAFGDGTPTERVPVTVSVNATVTGDQVGTLDISPVTYADDPMISPTIPGYLGSAYDLTLEGGAGQPSSATISFAYDSSLGSEGESFQPRIYYYNEEAGTLEELSNQTVSGNTVTASVEHFSTYLLLNKVEFDAVWEADIRPPDDASAGLTGLDVVFVIDTSGSMSWNDGSGLRVEAAKQFVEKLGEKDRAAVIDFDSSATLKTAFTSDHSTLASMIDECGDDNGGTNLTRGMSLAIDQFTNEEYTRTDAYKYIIFLTDGDGNYDTQLTTEAAEQGIVVFTVGLGSSIDEDLLKDIAEGTGGKYYFASSSDELLNIYYDLSFETVDYTTDSNQDGISDYYTELIKTGRLPLSNGSKEFMGYDFNYDRNGQPSNDFDGDGLLNGQEIQIETSGSRVYAHLYSDPAIEDSDGDGYPDANEYRMMGSDPMEKTYPGFAVDYATKNDFTYQDVLNWEDSWWKEGARNIWATITFNWSHEDEAKSLMASFFQNFSDLDSIEDLSSRIQHEVAMQMGQDVISLLIDGVEDGKYTIDTYFDVADFVKMWIASGNSAKNLSSDHFAQLKARLGLMEHKFATKFKGLSAFDKVGMGLSFAWDETTDFFDWVETYSALTATQAAFTESQDILKWMKGHDDAKEKYIAAAAEDILLLVDENYDEFRGAEMADFALSTGENLGSLALNILSAANPYTFAINVIVGVLDMITPTSEIGEATYRLYVIDEIANAAGSLFAYSGTSSDYYEIDEVNLNHLRMLSYAHMWGGEFGKKITGKQININIFKTDEMRKQYADAIDQENNNLERHLGRYFT